MSKRTFPIDSGRYRAGKAEWTWLNEEIAIDTAPGEGRQAVVWFFEHFLEGLEQKGCPIGHLKAWVEASDCRFKISVPTALQPDWQNSIPFFEAGRFTLLLNARIQASTETLRAVLEQTLDILRWTTRAVCTEQKSELFHPKAPTPTHRMP